MLEELAYYLLEVLDGRGEVSRTRARLEACTGLILRGEFYKRVLACGEVWSTWRVLQGACLRVELRPC